MLPDLDWRDVLRFFCWIPPDQLFGPDLDDTDGSRP